MNFEIRAKEGGGFVCGDPDNPLEQDNWDELGAGRTFAEALGEALYEKWLRHMGDDVVVTNIIMPAAPPALMEVEYYRCWPGSGGDSGQWDTAVITIPADTPAGRYDAAVRQACEGVSWEDNNPPAFVGFYGIIEPGEPPHLPAGTRVRLCRTLTDNETSCGDFREGTPGVLVDEDGDILFRPDGYAEGWGFYLSWDDYEEIKD